MEIFKGTGKVIHLQEKISTVESDQTEILNRTTTKKNYPYLPIFPEDTVEEIASPQLKPFISVQVGDKVKPI